MFVTVCSLVLAAKTCGVEGKRHISKMINGRIKIITKALDYPLFDVGSCPNSEGKQRGDSFEFRTSPRERQSNSDRCPSLKTDG